MQFKTASNPISTKTVYMYDRVKEAKADTTTPTTKKYRKNKIFILKSRLQSRLDDSLWCCLLIGH